MNLFTSAMFEGFPLRIGVAAGECVINRRLRIFVGQPIVDAYVTEEQQDWVGIGLHHSVFANETADLLAGSPKGLRHLVPYSVPTKSTADELKWTLDWPNLGSPPGQSELDGVVAFLEERVRHHAGMEYQRKWRNTLAFYNARVVRKKGDERA